MDIPADGISLIADQEHPNLQAKQASLEQTLLYTLE